MRNPIITTAIVAFLASFPAISQASASAEESVGVGAGATIGALAGGPVGLLVGAAIGAKLGDGFHRKDAEIESLAGSLQASDERVAQLEQDVDTLGADLEHMQSVSRPELLSLMQAGIEMDLLFRTDEDVLAADTGSRLEQLATTLAKMHDVRVRLDGFADERGDADYNQQLSARRAEHVRDRLVASGVPASRIKVAAHGESQAMDDNVDSFALERRVSLTLYIDETPSVASAPK